MREIPLNNSNSAIVDDELYDFLSATKWNVSYNLKTGRKYVHAYFFSKKKSVYMHRMIMGVYSGYDVDHINGDGLDNRRENLRHATTSLNNANYKLSRGVSIYKGVYWNKQLCRWHAQIAKDKINYHIGFYEKEYEAAIAYDIKAEELYGEYSHKNFHNIMDLI